MESPGRLDSEGGGSPTFVVWDQTEELRKAEAKRNKKQEERIRQEMLKEKKTKEWLDKM
jgi:hypothetical protein